MGRRLSQRRSRFPSHDMFPVLVCFHLALALQFQLLDDGVDDLFNDVFGYGYFSHLSVHAPIGSRPILFLFLWHALVVCVECPSL